MNTIKILVVSVLFSLVCGCVSEDRRSNDVGFGGFADETYFWDNSQIQFPTNRVMDRR